MAFWGGSKALTMSSRLLTICSPEVESASCRTWWFNVLALIQCEKFQLFNSKCRSLMLLLLLSRFSRVRLCATPSAAAHHAPLSLGFSSNSSGCLIQVHTPLQHPEHSSLSLLGVTWSPYMPSFLSSSHILDHISLLLLPASPRGLGDQCQDLGARWGGAN